MLFYCLFWRLEKQIQKVKRFNLFATKVILSYGLILGLFAFGLVIPVITPVKTAFAAAGINEQINFQGRLLNAQGATVPDGYYNIQFKIYQDGDGLTAGNTTGSPAGSLKWTESYLNASSQGVTVKNGFLSVQLGSITAFGSSIDWNQSTLWLSMNIAGTNPSCTPFSSCSPDGEMLPMKRLSATPYALNAGKLGGLTSNDFLQVGQTSAQTDASNNNSIYLNKTGTGNLLNLQSSGSSVFVLNNSGDITFGNNANHTISVNTAAASTAGKNLSLSAGGAGTGASALAGGNLVLQGGTGGGTNGNGGNVNIDGGAKNGTGTDGVLNIGTGTTNAVNIGKSGTITTISGTVNAASGPYQVNGVTVIDASRNLTNIAAYTGSGNINTTAGVYQINGTTVIDASRNLTNIASITASGNINTTAGGIQINGTTVIDSSRNIANTASVTTSGNFNTTAGGYLLNGTNINNNGTLNNVAYLAQANTFTVANIFQSNITVGLTGSNTGTVGFKGSTAASGTITLQGQANPTNNTITLPNETGTVCTTGSVCSGYLGTASLAGYVQLQPTTPGTQQTGNINVSGVGIYGNGLSVTTGGLTVSAGGASITGTTNINTAGTSATTIGNSGATVAIASSGLNVTTAGAVTGVTTLTTSSTINGQTISNAASFTGTLTVNGTTLTVGTPGTTTGSLKLANNTSSRNTLVQALSPTGSGDATIQFPSIAGSSTDTVCLVSAHNCVSPNGGTQNFVTKYTDAGATQLGNSSIFDNTTGVSIGGTSPAGKFNVGASNQFQVSSTGAVTAVGLNSGTGLIQGTGGLTVSGTITLGSLNSVGVVHTDASGVLSTSAILLGTDTSGSYVASLGSLTGLSTTGNSGAGSTPTLSVLYGSTANTSVQGNTTLVCPSASGNLSATGNTITLGAGGTCNAITMVNNPTFSGLVTANGGLTVATGYTFTNAGATLNTAKPISDKPTGGSIGANTATVDVATTFNVGQNTPSQTLSLPAPTDTTVGRIAYVTSTGTASFTMHGSVIASGEAASFVWNGTAWTALYSFNAGTGITKSGNTINTTAPTSVVNDTNVTGSIASNALTLGWTGTLAVSRGGTGAGSFTQNGILYGAGTGNIQVTAAAANSVLVTNGSNIPSLSQTLPTAVQGNITGVGALTSGSIASFGTIVTGNTISGTVLTGSTGFAISGATTAGHYLRNNGTNYVDSAMLTSDLSGTIFSLAGSTGTTQNVTTGGTVSILKGSSNNLTSVASTTNTITIDTVASPSFTTVTASTSLLSPTVDTAAAGTLSLGTATATGVTVGNTGGSTVTNVYGGTGGSAVNIQQGTGGVVTIGGTGASSSVIVQCGASATYCNFGTNATDHTTNVGSVTGASLTAIQGGTSGITLTSGNTVTSILTTGTTVKTNTNSATAFRVQNSTSNNVITVDTSTPALKIFAGAGGANYLGLTYNDGTTTGTIAASAGTTAVGSGSGAVTITAGTGSPITMTSNATALWRTTAGTLTMQSGTSSDLILTSGSNVVQVSGSSVVKLGASAGDPGTCTAGAVVYNTTTNTLRGCQGGTLAWYDLVNVTTPTLQQTYTASTGGTTPEIKLDTTRGALDIQGDNAGAVATILNVRAGTGSGLGTAMFSITAAGNTTIADNNGTALIVANGTNSLVQIGSATPHASNPTTLVLDAYQPATAGSNPTVVDGAMYYDADAGVFRCGINSFWQNCAINNIESSYVFEDEFLSGAAQTAAATSLTGVGNLGWNVSTTASCAVAYNQNVAGTGPGINHDHPGTLRLTTNTTNPAGCVMTQGGTAAGSPTLNQLLDRGDTYKSAFAISTATGTMRAGWSNQTGTTAPTSGAWWQYTGGNLQYCYANNATAVCATATTLATNTWAEVEIHINSVTAGAVNIVFTSNIGGVSTSNTTTANFDAGTTNRLTPGASCVTTGTAQNCYIDYIQWSGYNTSGDGIRD